MITGFLTPTSGSARICDIDVVEDPVAAQRTLGYLPEGAPAWSDMTVNAYLHFIASVRHLRGTAAGQAIDYVVDRTHIDRVMYQPIETLSKGYRRRVGLAQALLHDPDVLILDEPTDGLDPNQKYEVRELIREISPNKAIIISTHILEEIDALCSRSIIIADGKVVADATPRSLQSRSSTHNAVCLSVAHDEAARIKHKIEQLPGVENVIPGNVPARHHETSNVDELIALPESGQEILASIASCVRENDWRVQQLRLSSESLDDVFRDLTTGNVQANNANRPTLSAISPAPVESTLRYDTWTIFKREFSGYFSTPVAYVFIVILLAAMGSFTFFTGHFFTQRQATLDAFFQFHPWLFLVFVPAITMRLWAEERKTGSIEMLLTLPVTTLGVVLGKFLAAWAITVISLVLSATMWITVNYLGSPDNASIATGYLGSVLVAGCFTAIGGFVSALTRNQVIAFIVSAAVCFAFTASGLNAVLDFFSDWAPQLLLDSIAGFSFLERFRDISRGVIALSDIVFFVSTIAFFVFATVVAIERRKND